MNHISLFELNKQIQSTLSASLEPGYWVIAEISELKVNPNGHCYLELIEKDEHIIKARMRATIWANVYNNLSLWFERMTNQQLKSGIKILCYGTVQFHEMYGLSFNIKDLDADFTLGEKERRRQEIINRLQADGVFDMNHHMTVDSVFDSIALISSPAAAGYEDFMDQIETNIYGYQYQIKLFKATMQGDRAAESIINALHQINNSSTPLDAVFIIRGGGSKIDLDCFDDYELCLHCCQFPLPVIAGIGHERDQSILDLVAYKSLKTPTAAAEWLINKSLDFERSLVERMNRISTAVSLIIKEKTQHLTYHVSRIQQAQKLAIQRDENELMSLASQLKRLSNQRIKDYGVKMDLIESKIKSIDPIEILKKGYSITTANGKSIMNQRLKSGDVLKTRTYRQEIESTITQTKKIDDKE